MSSAHVASPEHQAIIRAECGQLETHLVFAQLPDHLQKISRPICELALELCATLPDSPEKVQMMRKFVEAKDCAVRAALSPPPIEGDGK